MYLLLSRRIARSFVHLDLGNLNLFRPALARHGGIRYSVMPVLRKHLNNPVLPKQVWARDLDIRI